MSYGQRRIAGMAICLAVAWRYMTAKSHLIGTPDDEIGLSSDEGARMRSVA